MALPDTSISTAALVGSWVAAVVYGLNIPLFLLCYRVMRNTNRILFTVTAVHLVLATAHAAITLAYLVKGFLQIHTSAESNAYYALQSTPLHLGQFWLYFLLIMVGDGIMAWRCYIVSKRNNLVGIVFATLLAAYLVCDITNLVRIGKTRSEQEFFEAFTWMTAVFTLSLGIQFVATSVIVWKIWSATLRRSNTPNRHSNLAVIWIMVESGAILTGASASVLIMFRLKLNAGALVAPIHGQLSFFIPASIIARAALRHTTRRDPAQPMGIRFRDFRVGFRQEVSSSSAPEISLSSTQKTSQSLTTAEPYTRSTDGTLGPVQEIEYEPVTTLKAVHSPKAMV